MPEGQQRDLKASETVAVEMVKQFKCPVCAGPLVPRHDPDDPSIVRAKACPRHGEFTTPKGRSRVKAARQAKGLEPDA